MDPSTVALEALEIMSDLKDQLAEAYNRIVLQDRELVELEAENQQLRRSGIAELTTANDSLGKVCEMFAERIKLLGRELAGERDAE